MSYRNRIVGHGEEVADQLAANPRNWRVHPHTQEAALAGVLDKIGWVDTVMVDRQTGFVVDGHLRVAHAISTGEPTVPVTYVDLTEDEEALVLATLDPLAGLAVPDANQLKLLLAGIETTNEGIEKLLQTLADSVAGAVAPDGFPSFDETIPTEHQCPKCGYRWSGGVLVASLNGDHDDDDAA